MALLCTRVGFIHFRSTLCTRVSPVRTISIKKFIIKQALKKRPTEFDVKEYSPVYGFKAAPGIGYLKRCRKLKNLFLVLLMATTAYSTYLGHIPLRVGVNSVIVGKSGLT